MPDPTKARLLQVGPMSDRCENCRAPVVREGDRVQFDSSQYHMDAVKKLSEISALNGYVDELQQQQDEIIVALGSAGISRSEIVDAVKRQSAENSLKAGLLSQLYQIVGSMADDIGVFEYDNVQALLTEIVEPTGKQFLPWDSFSDKAPASNERDIGQEILDSVKELKGTQDVGQSNYELGQVAESGRSDV